jgi:glycosyltransferase involved in cell wall biosynthesis
MEARLGAKGLPGKLKVLIFDSMVKRVLRRANVVISISEYDAKSLGDLVQGQRISISNPIGAEFFSKFTEPELHPTLFFAGVMRPRKNVVGLVKAFAQTRAAIPQARLVIAGPMPEPDYAAQVKAQVEAHKLQDAVSFLGHVSNDQLLDAMRNSAALALFSYEETSPTVIAQALAVGRPVVASRVGGIPEMVQEDQTGYLVEPGDDSALAERLTRLFSDLPRARAMGIDGRKFAQQRYEPSAVAQQTVEAYRSAIARNR